MRSGSVAASAPVRVRDRLRRSPDGPLRALHRTPHALYLDLHGSCLGLVDEVAAQVPCALRTTRAALATLAAADARVRSGELYLDGVRVAIGRMVEVRAPRVDLEALLRTPRPAAAPVPPAAVATLLAPLAGGDPAGHVGALVGRGEGLTPLGDDLLCGWLGLHRAAGVATPAVDAQVRAHLDRTTALSATLLDCALHGEVLPQFAGWVLALGRPAGTRPGALLERRTAAALLAVGHTSGAGLLHGALLALSSLAHTNGVAA